jgi:hypothetical protein
MTIHPGPRHAHAGLRHLACVLLLALSPAAALAHSDEYLDSIPSPNGGQVRMVGAYHFELLVKPNPGNAADTPFVVFVTDHANAKVSTKGATATATFLANRQKITATLAPDGDNRLKGSALLAHDPEMRVVLSVTLAGAKAEQVRFTPLKPRAPAARK